MRRNFIVERQGRSFVLYAGLLDLVHQQGLTGIRTEIVQLPTVENGNTAICSATVTVERGGKVMLFTGIGDASPKNVAPAMETCLLRMAETRSKARALRDAVNVGVAAFEELGEVQEGEGGDSVPQRSTLRPTRPVMDNGAPATESQRKALMRLCGKQSIEVPDFEHLTFGQAARKIQELQGGQKG
jgi:hypothetical protein